MDLILKTFFPVLDFWVFQLYTGKMPKKAPTAFFKSGNEPYNRAQEKRW